jgi:hypothetical protein
MLMYFQRDGTTLFFKGNRTVENLELFISNSTFRLLNSNYTIPSKTFADMLINDVNVRMIYF